MTTLLAATAIFVPTIVIAYRIGRAHLEEDSPRKLAITHTQACRQMAAGPRSIKLAAVLGYGIIREKTPLFAADTSSIKSP